ncbi:MAG: choline ABC transporter permease subunit, partial [Halocynthiibacter sp.]
MAGFTESKIPVGKTISAAFDWLTDHFGGVFDSVDDVLGNGIDGFLWLLQFPPAWVMIVLFAGLTWGIQRSIPRVLIVVFCFLYVLNQGYWQDTTESLTLIFFAVIFCMGVGVPIGIYAAHHPRFFKA